ncbi:hypothetical protein M8J77_010033 [Diaphorina citri]|nr:hypothetical protein M8J77_010033 [Diaphorina citri]
MVITVQSNTEASVSMNVGYSEDPFPIYLRRAEDSYDLYVSEPQGTLITNSESQVMFTNSADPEIEVDRKAAVSHGEGGIRRNPPCIWSMGPNHVNQAWTSLLDKWWLEEGRTAAAAATPRYRHSEGIHP